MSIIATVARRVRPTATLGAVILHAVDVAVARGTMPAVACPFCQRRVESAGRLVTHVRQRHGERIKRMTDD